MLQKLVTTLIHIKSIGFLVVHGKCLVYRVSPLSPLPTAHLYMKTFFLRSKFCSNLENEQIILHTVISLLLNNMVSAIRQSWVLLMSSP